MKSKRRILANFEARSVMLFAAYAFSGSNALQAQPNTKPISHTAQPSTALRIKLLPLLETNHERPHKLGPPGP